MPGRDLVVFIHGFLGQAEDWSLCAEALSASFLSKTELSCIDLFRPESPFKLSRYDSFSQWSNHWAQQISQLKKEGYQRITLCGYSLGGRLALAAAEKCGAELDGLILISSHPGLEETSAREQRRFADARWAQRFRDDDWSEVLNDWNGQGVLQSMKGLSPKRFEPDYDKEALECGLTRFSLAEQKDFRAFLGATSVPVLWIIGGEDAKFHALAHSLPFNEERSHLTIKNCGHRIPFEEPQRLGCAIETFLT